MECVFCIFRSRQGFTYGGVIQVRLLSVRLAGNTATVRGTQSTLRAIKALPAGLTWAALGKRKYINYSEGPLPAIQRGEASVRPLLEHVSRFYSIHYVLLQRKPSEFRSRGGGIGRTRYSSNRVSAYRKFRDRNHLLNLRRGRGRQRRGAQRMRDKEGREGWTGGWANNW